MKIAAVLDMQMSKVPIISGYVELPIQRDLVTSFEFDSRSCRGLFDTTSINDRVVSSNPIHG